MLSSQTESGANLLNFLRVLQHTEADLRVFAVFQKVASVPDIVSVLRMAKEFGASDILTIARLLSDFLVGADLLSRLTIAFLESSADIRAQFDAWRDEATKTNLLGSLALFRPRLFSVSPIGGPRQQIVLWTYIDPHTKHVRIGPWQGKRLRFKSHIVHEHEEPGWGTDAWIDLMLDPKWWWKHGRASLLADLEWRIYVLTRHDLRADLSQRRHWPRMASIGVLLKRWFGGTDIVRFESTDDDWNAGELTNLITHAGRLSIQPVGDGKHIKFYGDDRSYFDEERNDIGLKPYRFGIRISPPLDLSAISEVRTTYICWEAKIPAHSGIAIDVAMTDGERPTAWVPAENGRPIPVIAPGMDLAGKVLWIRQKFWTQSKTKTPELKWLYASIFSGGGEASDLRAALGKYVPKSEQIRSRIEILTRQGDRAILQRMVLTEALLRMTEHGILEREALAEMLDRLWEV